jgi:hypothetical protein
VAEHLPLGNPVALPTRRIGGGPRTPPRNPHRHGQKLTQELTATLTSTQSIEIVEGVDPALVFRIRATGRLSAEQWHSRGLELLSEGGDWDYVVLSPGEGTPEMAGELARYAAAPDRQGAKARLSSFFGTLEAIEPYRPEDRLADNVAETLDGEPGPVDILIWAAPDIAEATRRIEQVTAAVEAHGGKVTASDRRPRSPVIRAILDGAAARSLASIPVVEAMRLPAFPYVDPADWRDIREENLEVQRRDGPPVGVLDDAIATGHPLLSGLVNVTRSFPAGHAWQQMGEHGTMVAGLAAYGDFETPLREHTPFVASGSLVQGRVIEPRPGEPHRHQFPPEQPEHLTIEEAIVALNDEYDVRVFVLCVTEIDPYSGPRVSLLTERLDDLIQERDLIVVVPTGNHGVDIATARMDSGGHALHDYPGYALHEVARVSEPATAALAVTVGSIARSDGPANLAGVTQIGHTAVAPVDGLSPFSRSGPGAYKGVKPELVHYGGNLVVRPGGGIASPESGTGVVSLILDGGGRLFGVGSGTSFAAPRVARIAADVLSVYPDASGNLVRALLGLSASMPDAVSEAFGGDVCRVAGHGLPVSARASASTGLRTVLMGEYSMAADTVAIHPLPIPSAFQSVRAARSIKIALAFDPPVRRTRREYLAGEMSFDLLRASSLAEVQSWYRRQDPGEPLKLPGDRRRPKLDPGIETTANSTLVVRGVRRRLFEADDGDTYYLAVTHSSRPWAEKGQQTYALAVAFEEEERQDVDLYVELQQRVRPRVRVRP